MEVHLDHGNTIRHQHPLETADPIHFPPHYRRRSSGIEYRAAQEVLVPARVQDNDPPARRHDAPVSPHGGALPLDVVRRAESVGRDELRVEPAEQFVHHLAAAGAGDTRDDHRHRALRVLAQHELRIEQPVLQLR